MIQRLNTTQKTLLPLHVALFLGALYQIALIQPSAGEDTLLRVLYLLFLGLTLILLVKSKASWRMRGLLIGQLAAIVLASLVFL